MLRSQREKDKNSRESLRYFQGRILFVRGETILSRGENQFS